MRAPSSNSGKNNGKREPKKDRTHHPVIDFHKITETKSTGLSIIYQATTALDWPWTDARAWRPQTAGATQPLDAGAQNLEPSAYSDAGLRDADVRDRPRATRPLDAGAQSLEPSAYIDAGVRDADVRGRLQATRPLDSGAQSLEPSTTPGFGTQT